MNLLKLEIITPQKIAFKAEVKSVTLPGTLGSFQVLYNHASLISTLEIGRINAVLEDGAEKIFAASGGTAEVLSNKILVLVNSLERVDEIDLDRARRARDRAKKRLETKNSNVNVERAESALARALNRIRLAEQYEEEKAKV